MSRRRGRRGSQPMRRRRREAEEPVKNDAEFDKGEFYIPVCIFNRLINCLSVWQTQHTFVTFVRSTLQFYFLFGIAGFSCGSTEFVRLLGYYTAWGGLKRTFRDYLSVLFSTVNVSTWILWLFKMGKISSPKTFVSSHLDNLTLEDGTYR